MGVGSYNTVNENAVLSRYGEVLKPDLVVLVYVGNDIELTPTQEFDPWSAESLHGKGPPQVFHLILNKSWTYRLVSHLSRFRKSKAETRLSTSSAGWKQSVSALRDISDYCNSLNIPLFVFMYRMMPNQLENDIARELNLLSMNMEFYFEDVLPWFKGKDIRSLINSLVDSHPNALGHMVLAEGIASALQQNIISGRED